MTQLANEEKNLRYSKFMGLCVGIAYFLFLPVSATASGFSSSPQSAVADAYEQHISKTTSNKVYVGAMIPTDVGQLEKVDPTKEEVSAKYFNDNVSPWAAAGIVTITEDKTWRNRCPPNTSACYHKTTYKRVHVTPAPEILEMPGVTLEPNKVKGFVGWPALTFPPATVKVKSVVQFDLKDIKGDRYAIMSAITESKCHPTWKEVRKRISHLKGECGGESKSKSLWKYDVFAKTWSPVVWEFTKIDQPFTTNQVGDALEKLGL